MPILPSGGNIQHEHKDKLSVVGSVLLVSSFAVLVGLVGYVGLVMYFDSVVIQKGYALSHS